MKKLLGIFYVLLLAFVLTGCKSKYTTIYCDFDAGDFKSEGYYYLRNLDEVKKFKLEHNASAQMSQKLHYDDSFFKNKFVIVLVLPEASSDVSYKIESIDYKTSTLDVVIKKSSSGDSTTKPDTNGGNGSTNNGSDSNGEGNNGSIMDKAEDIIDNIGDSLTDNNNNSNNGGSGSTTPDNNGGSGSTTPDNNGGSGTTTPDNNSGSGTTTPDNNGGSGTTTPDNNQGGTNTPTNPSNLVNKAFIFEFKKTDTVTKINFKIV